MTLLADIWNKTDAPSLGNGVIALVVTLTIVALVLTVITLAAALWQRFFVRKPPVDEDLRDLRESLKNLAPAEQVNALVDRLANAATKGEIDKIREDMKGYVDQAQMDRRMDEVKEMIARMDRDQTRQIKELRAYLHEDVHGFREMAQATWATAAEQREGLNNRMNTLAEAMSEVRGWLRAKFGQEGA